MNNKKNIVFILGVERSGSTFLANLIAQEENVNSIGELPHVHRNPETRKCGCGDLLKNCEVWTGLASQANYLTLSNTPFLLRNRSAFFYNFQFLRKYILKRQPSIQFINTYIAAYDHFITKTGSEIIVDSAKNFTLPYHLNNRSDINLKVVFINRDAIGIEDSLSKRKEMGHQDYKYHSFLSTILKWKLSRTFFKSLTKQLPEKTMEINYQDLIKDPQSTIAKINDFISSERKETVQVEDGYVHLRANHTCGGSPSRFKVGKVKLSQNNLKSNCKETFKNKIINIMCN
jgi:hypothetical protein